RDGSSLVLSQQRFTYLPAANGKEQRWHVPVQVRFHRGKDSFTQRQVLTGADLRLPLSADSDAVVVNAEGNGFFRVAYSGELREGLLRQLANLSPIERFNLLNDSLAVTIAGGMSLTAFLDLTSHFRGERDKNVWAVLLGSFHALHRIVDAVDRPGFERLV